MNRNNSSIHKNFMSLAFEKAYENLGSTKENPSVGCIIVKDGAVISSGVTSINGRPHAESNALKKNKNFYGSSMYVTLEPCPMCAGAILLVRVPATIMTSDWRGLGRNTTPKRSRS